MNMLRVNSMKEAEQENETPSATLCKACGLCCTGHLFVSAQSKPSEVEATQALGLRVVQPNSEEAVFLLPCPLWKEQCTIYTHPHKPSICGDFRCKLLRELEAEQLPVADALAVVERTKQLIQELDEQIPVGHTNNFRKNLFEYLHQLERSPLPTEAGNAFRLRAGALLVLFAQRFGVTDLFNQPEQEQSSQGKSTC